MAVRKEGEKTKTGRQIEGEKNKKKRLLKERGCVTPTRTGSLNFPPGRRVTEPKANA